MKTLAVSMILALGLAAPALAQQTQNTPPAKEVAVDDSTPMDELIAEASSEDRMKLLMRCAGPPPKALSKAVAATEPKSEPAVVASTGTNSGG